VAGGHDGPPGGGTAGPGRNGFPANFAAIEVSARARIGDVTFCLGTGTQSDIYGN